MPCSLYTDASGSGLGREEKKLMRKAKCIRAKKPGNMKELT